MNFERADGDCKQTGRLEAFSDGVFAIAVTLLVLDIHVPSIKDNQSLFTLLLHDWETFLAFGIGFFTLLVCWINHHFMFELIQRNNGMLLLLNGFKLLVVSLTPFATALLSRCIDTPQQETAVSIYAFNFFMMGSAMTGLWLYAAKNQLIVSRSAPLVTAATRLYIFASLLSGTIFIVSFFSMWISLVLFVLMFVIFVFPKSLVTRMAKSSYSGTLDNQTIIEAAHSPTVAS